MGKDGRMIRISPANYYRAAATVVAAAVLSFTAHHASAQQNIDLFAGTPGMLSLPGSLSVAPTMTSGTFGPGFNGNLTLTGGALNTLSETFATSGSSNTFAIAQTGFVTLLGTTSAAKTFTGVPLTPGGTYVLTLVRSAGSTLTLLSNVNLSLTDGSTTLLNSATGQGFAGIVNVLNLFGTNNTATVQFTVPTNATGDLGLNIGSTEAGRRAGRYLHVPVGDAHTGARTAHRRQPAAGRDRSRAAAQPPPVVRGLRQKIFRNLTRAGNRRRAREGVLPIRRVGPRPCTGSAANAPCVARGKSRKPSSNWRARGNAAQVSCELLTAVVAFIPCGVNCKRIGPRFAGDLRSCRYINHPCHCG